MQELKVMVLGASRYQFNDRNTNKEVKGTTVHYIQLTNSNNDDSVGFKPTKATLPYESLEQFKGVNFPVIANAQIELDLGNSRNPIKVKSFLLEDSVVY